MEDVGIDHYVLNDLCWGLITMSCLNQTRLTPPPQHRGGHHYRHSPEPHHYMKLPPQHGVGDRDRASTPAPTLSYFACHFDLM